jgi:hypothetical protein
MSNKHSDEQIDTAHSNQGEASSSRDSDATPQGETGRTRTAAQVPVADLLEQEAMLPFAGLTLQDPREYPEEVSANGQYFSGSPRSFKEVIQVLPRAADGELWATNEFVDTTGAVDLEAIRNVKGLDLDGLEAQTGKSLTDLTASADSEPIVRVRDHKDIVDQRRKALNALGYDVRFRWQIASDSYAIINPQQAYLPIINALQRRGATDAFGWASYRDWGGLLKMAVICPSLRHVVAGAAETSDSGDDVDETAGLTHVASDGEAADESAQEELVVYGGFQTGYDFRGTQTLWARPILFFPDSGTIIPDTGERYTRRHYGKATDALHERKNDRVPINEWWKAIYDDVDLRMVDVDQAICKTRAIAYDFEALPFSLVECYQFWGVAAKYAERAADRASALATPHTRPTVFNIQLSLLIVLLEQYDGSMASNTYQEYLETAGELLRTPAMMIQLALKEYDRRTDDSAERILPDSQQTLSDVLEDVVDVPGIEVDTEADLSDSAAQRVQDHIQRKLSDCN